MKNKSPRLTVYLIAVFVMTVFSVIMRTVAMLTSLNLTTGYYADKLIIGIADWSAVAAVVLGLSYVFSGRRSTKLVATYDGPASFIPSAAVSLSSLFLGIKLIERFEELRAISGGKTWNTVTIPGIIAIILAFLCSAAFFVNVLRIGRRDDLRALLQISAVLFLSVYAMFIYFDNALSINSPNRLTDISAYLIASLFMLYEIRLSLGRDVWGAYTAFGMAAQVATAYSSIPSIIFYISGRGVVSHSVNETILTLSLFLFISLRLLGSLTLFEEKESKIVGIIKSQEKLANASKEEEPEGEEEQNDSEDNYTFDIATDESKEEKDAE